MKDLFSSRYFWVSTCILLMIPALLVNLGMQPFFEDEAIRATVSLEMIYSGNYITPTINGEFYYYKPPLYNWILIPFCYLFGYGNEWVFRFPTILFLIVFGWLLYNIHRRENFGFSTSVLSALFFITCGRILFWDSLLGLIDVCYSLVMYGMMVYIYLDFKKDKIPILFIRAYVMTSIGFMLKGYPTFLFLGFTLLVVFYLNKKLKYLWHPFHLIGFIVMIILIGGYYFTYSQINDATETIIPLLDQATRRTILKYDFLDVISNIITYPFENVYHFLPWSLMTILLVRSDFFKLLKQNPFVEFSFFAFLINIIVYWVSPEVFPRYILMLAPLAFTVFLYFYHIERLTPSIRFNVLEIIFKGLAILIPLIMVTGLITQDLSIIENITIKALVLVGSSAILLYAYFKYIDCRLFIFIAILLIVRITFNFFVIPLRTESNIATLTSNQAIKIAQKYGGDSLSVYNNSVIDVTSTFYIEKELGYILGRRKDTPYKIIDLSVYEIPDGFEAIDSFMIRRDERLLNIIRQKE